MSTSLTSAWSILVSGILAFPTSTRDVLGMLFDLAEVVILDVAVKFVAHKPDDPRNDHLHISILSRILSLL